MQGALRALDGDGVIGSSTFTSTPAGMTMGFLPILDIVLPPPLPHKGEHFAADMLLARAALSVMTPLEVEMIAMPRPFMTLGISSVGVNAQTRLGNALQARDDRKLHFPVILQGQGDNTLLAVVGDCHTLDVAFVNRIWRLPSSGWKQERPRKGHLAVLALRMRVSRSAIGSVIACH